MPATNAPASKLSNAGWYAAYSGTVGTSSLYYLTYNNYFGLGAPSTTSYAYGATLEPEEAWNIDTKMDDGRPAMGNVIAMYWNNACSAPDSGAVANTNLNASYRLSDGSKQCSLIFRNAF